jgi:parvulin-like peptidyl-prolyl isomerase
MSRLRLLALPALALAIALAAGCGGGGGGGSTTSSAEEVPADAVAMVAGTPILRSDYERLFNQAEAAYADQGNEFPKAGTPEYAQLQKQTVDYLIQQAEFSKEAEVLGIQVSSGDVEKRLGELKDQFFDGDDAKYQEEIAKQGYTDADVHDQIRAQLVSERIFDNVTKGATVTDAEVQTYYDENKDQFTTPESREVAHILVDTKKLADDIYQQLQDGADFAALAKEHSTDTASAQDGGKLTDERGSFVPEFEEVAFALETGEVGKPVESQFGWHVIKALADTQPETTTPFAEAKQSIEDQLLQDKRNKLMEDWVAQIRQKYASQIAYAVGFEPAAAATTTTTTP